MKSIKFLILALLCAVAQGAWAQSPTAVSTDDELRAAIQTNGANITVTADIDLSNSTLSIESGKTITIDLNGHTLDRKLNSRGEGGGQVITVRSGAKLYLSNGTLKGGWGGNAGGLSNESGTANLTNVNITNCKGDDNGGGICNLGGTLTMTGGSITNNTCYDHGDPAGGGGLFNAEGATATLTGVTITGNEDMVCGGGGICNYGTILLDGCTITGNKARTVGGGIWSTNKNGFKMQGSNIITDNIAGGVPSNIFLKAHCLITLTDSITGSRIGVMLDVAPYWFVDGFATYHSGEDPNTFFTCDKPWVDSLAIIQPEPWVQNVGEVIMRRKNLKGKVPYIEHSWDSENNKVLYTTKILTEEIGLDETPTNETQYKKLKSSNLFVTLGTENSELHEYYVAEGDELNIKALDIEGPNVHIILRDSAWLHLEEDIFVSGGSTVYFHAQSTGSYIGKLTSGEGIGGSNPQDGGANIEIHGGNFDLQGAESCAAIGGKYETNGNITIYDGHIKATGGDAAAGIGSGYGCTDYGHITIYGGKIEATGSAGIGGGQECLNGKLTIWDGAITARGQSESAGIGGSQYGSDYAAGTITINGGYIRAYGATHGAGIGGGDGKDGGTLNVNGGRVDAYGGTDAAGIGGGEGGEGGIVNITGGYVYAEGNDYGAGIGGGQDGAGANVTITGGTVIAKAGANAPSAIGAGEGEDSHNNLSFADNLGVFITTNLYRSVKANRVSDCRSNQYVKINECTHGGATIDDNGSSVSVDCPYCYTATIPYTFKANGNWNDESKWFSSIMPNEGKDVAVKAFATIPADYCANVGNIALQDGGSITIADGGQLIHSNAGVTTTVQKSIGKYTVETGAGTTDGWHLIASPVSTNNTPNVAMLSNDFDLYRLNNTTWENWKQEGDHYHFNLENSRGYLYANSEDVTIEFTGTVLPSAASQEVSVSEGFNLIGNPFLHNVYADRVYYKMNDERTGIVAVENYQENPITPCTGIIVNADAAGTVALSKDAPSLSNHNGSLQIALAQVVESDNQSLRGGTTKQIEDSTPSQSILDNAIVSFNEGVQLEKFYFGNDAKLYIPQGGKDYAIAPVGRDAARHVSTEIPLNFKATENGEYTITVNPEGVEMAYLHLIDNMTGADIDLLRPETLIAGEDSVIAGEDPQSPSYTFQAKTTDYASRFRLVFSAASTESAADAPFAYIDASGNIIITVDASAASLQVIDMMGRVIISKNAARHVSTSGIPAGVYVLRLIDGENIRTQKMVIQ